MRLRRDKAGHVLLVHSDQVFEQRLVRLCQKERGDRVLQRLADATGGRAFFPLKIENVGKASAQIKDELRSQYALAYKPASLTADGNYHSIQILAQNHKNLRARARKGYFAPQ